MKCRLIWRCDPAELGATKLNKICWYADIEYYRRTGRTITGADHYKRLQFGPAPKGVHLVLDTLAHEEKIVIASENYYGKPKRMFIARSRPDLSAFNADEIADPLALADRDAGARGNGDQQLLGGGRRGGYHRGGRVAGALGRA